jgi:hypothetical protein
VPAAKIAFVPFFAAAAATFVADRLVLVRHYYTYP